MYSVGAVKVGGDYKVGVYSDERESFWRVVNKCIEEHGHVIISTYIKLKTKYSFCRSVEDVERELSAESDLYDMTRKSGWFSVYSTCLSIQRSVAPRIPQTSLRLSHSATWTGDTMDDRCYRTG